LVVHQRNQRRYDDACAIHDNGRQLIAQGLARSSRHDGKRTLSGKNARHDLFLLSAKACKSK
jgi:hypothetical protein